MVGTTVATVATVETVATAVAKPVVLKLTLNVEFFFFHLFPLLLLPLLPKTKFKAFTDPCGKEAPQKVSITSTPSTCCTKIG
jgi:hypothetical protein